jgi:hypothetical protein
MADADTRSLSGAGQAALRNRAVQAVLDGMPRAEAARVFRVHHKAVNRWSSRSREVAGQGLPSSVAAAVRVNSRPCPSASSRSSSRWFATAPRSARPGGVSVDPRCGCRVPRPARWRVAGPHHGRWVSARLGSARSGPSGAPWSRIQWWWRAGWPPSSRPSVPGPAGRVGWCGGWMRWGPLGCGSGPLLGAGGPDSGHQADRQALPGQHDQRHFQPGTAAVPPVHRVVHRGGVHRLPAPTATRLPGPQGAPDRGRPSGAPGQAGQRLVGRHGERIELHFLPGDSPELNPVELLPHDVKANPAGRRGPRSAANSARSCTDICVVASVSHRSWFASSTIRRLGMPPPHQPHHLPAEVITLLEHPSDQAGRIAFSFEEARPWGARSRSGR